MNQVKIQMQTVTGGRPPQRLLLTTREVRLLAQDPERTLNAIHVRATHMSRVLEAILREPHGNPHWGLND